MAVYALTTDGRVTKCTAMNPGEKGCNHIIHGKPGQSSKAFRSDPNVMRLTVELAKKELRVNKAKNNNFDTREEDRKYIEIPGYGYVSVGAIDTALSFQYCNDEDETPIYVNYTSDGDVYLSSSIEDAWNYEDSYDGGVYRDKTRIYVTDPDIDQDLHMCTSRKNDKDIHFTSVNREVVTRVMFVNVKDRLRILGEAKNNDVVIPSKALLKDLEGRYMQQSIGNLI